MQGHHNVPHWAPTLCCIKTNCWCDPKSSPNMQWQKRSYKNLIWQFLWHTMFTTFCRTLIIWQRQRLGSRPKSSPNMRWQERSYEKLIWPFLSHLIFTFLSFRRWHKVLQAWKREVTTPTSTSQAYHRREHNRPGPPDSQGNGKLPRLIGETL